MVKTLKTRKSNRKKLITTADKLWASIIKTRDQKCVHCGSKINLAAHHIFTKARHGNLRWELCNGVTLCARCHTFGVHINPAPYMLSIMDYIGQETMQKLRELARLKPTPLKIDQLQLIVDSLQQFFVDQ